MRKHVKGNVSWVGYIDWELESFHGDDYSIMNGSSQNAYLRVLVGTIRLETSVAILFTTSSSDAPEPMDCLTASISAIFICR